MTNTLTKKQQKQLKLLAEQTATHAFFFTLRGSTYMACMLSININEQAKNEFIEIFRVDPLVLLNSLMDAEFDFTYLDAIVAESKKVKSIWD